MGRKRANRFQDKKRELKRKQKDDQLVVGLANYANSAGISDSDNNEGFSDDELEQSYESRPRKLQAHEDEVERLPIKKGGKVERVVVKAAEIEKNAHKEKEEEEEEQEQENDEDMEDDDEDDGEEEKEEAEEEVPQDSAETILQLKEEIAKIVEKIMEEPEENIASLTRLVRMAQSKNPNTARFSLLALVPTFKSIIPGYRIRSLTETEKREKVSKEVQKLRNFEQTLVLNYKNYIELLNEYSKNAKKDLQMSNFAIKAACELAANFQNFNYRPDVLIIIIRRICKHSTKKDPLFHDCIQTLETLMKDDDNGDISFDVVRLLTKTIRNRKFRIDESVLNTFLSLNILSDYDPNGVEEEKENKPKIKKKDRIHLSKKERKARKERKEIEEELRVAEQAISEKERERFQADILKLLLTLYLDILKDGSNLLFGGVFEGLSKIGHMVNFDLLGDFLEVIKEVVRDLDINNSNLQENDSLRLILLSIVTGFALVSNHSQYKINMDLSNFIDSLYPILFPLSFDADIEFSYKTLRLADPLANDFKKPSVNVSTKIELLLKSLENIFFKSKNGSIQRSLAFSKKLATCLLFTPEKSTIALIKFLTKLMAKYSEISSLFSTEDRISNGTYKMESSVVSRSNAEAATMYEILLLEKHYSPIVSKGAKQLLHLAKEETR